MANDVLNERWNIKASEHLKTKDNNLSQITEIEQKIDKLLDRISKTSDEQLINYYEDEIKKLHKLKRLAEQDLQKNFYTQNNFGTASDLVFTALKNPLKMWRSEDYNDKRSIILMYFEDSLRYNKKTGFRTTTLAYPVSLINDSFSQGSSNVDVYKKIRTSFRNR